MATRIGVDVGTASANLVLHDIDEPHLWHGNTLTGQETYGGLFTDAPELFIVVDEGVLFQVNQTAFVQTKRKLLDECELRCMVSVPARAFANAGAGVQTNLLFFTKGRPTEPV
jgi:type I restriction enzyme M protein